MTLVELICNALTTPGFENHSLTGGRYRYLRPAALSGDERGIIAAAYDGSVLCYTPQGRRLWIARPGNDFPYDLCVADSDGDQRDKALVAAAGGTLHAVDDDGSLLWSFHCTGLVLESAADELTTLEVDAFHGVLSLEGRKTGWFHVEEIPGRWYTVSSLSAERQTNRPMTRRFSTRLPRVKGEPRRASVSNTPRCCTRNNPCPRRFA